MTEVVLHGCKEGGGEIAKGSGGRALKEVAHTKETKTIFNERLEGNGKKDNTTRS
jgi:hypothetical protein